MGRGGDRFNDNERELAGFEINCFGVKVTSQSEVGWYLNLCEKNVTGSV